MADIKKTVARLRCRNAVLIPQVSAGLVVFSRNEAGAMVVALVRQRCSYAMRDIIFGRWNTAEYLAQLAAAVTPEEATVLLLADYASALGYATIKSRKGVEAKLAMGNPRYAAVERRFNEHICSDRVVSALKTAPFGRKPWSIPRGRPRAGETLLECAYREFGEETGLENLSALSIHRGCSRSNEFVIANGNYRITYHCATLQGTPPLAVRATKQLCEIAETGWATMAEMREKIEPRQIETVCAFAKYVRKRKLI